MVCLADLCDPPVDNPGYSLVWVDAWEVCKDAVWLVGGRRLVGVVVGGGMCGLVVFRREFDGSRQESCGRWLWWAVVGWVMVGMSRGDAWKCGWAL